MRGIQLTKGYVALVDDLGCDSVWGFKWHAAVRKGKVYAACKVRRPDGKWATEYLHRFLLGVTDPAIQVDHVDGNTLDNRRANLRRCTHAENQRNQRKYRGKSQFKGVVWRKNDGKWLAQIGVNGKQLHLGYFCYEREAAFAYDRVALQRFGEFACLNFPQEKKGGDV